LIYLPIIIFGYISEPAKTRERVCLKTRIEFASPDLQCWFDVKKTRLNEKRKRERRGRKEEREREIDR